MTNKHEASYYYDSHASNISLELRSGSRTSWKKQASHQKTGQARPTVKQVPYRPDSSWKQELSVKKSVVLYMDDGIVYEIDTLLYTSKTTVLVRRSRSIEERESGKQFMTNFELSCLKEMTRDHLLSWPLMPAHNFWSKGPKKRHWETCVQTCSL